MRLHHFDVMIDVESLFQGIIIKYYYRYALLLVNSVTMMMGNYNN